LLLITQADTTLEKNTSKKVHFPCFEQSLGHVFEATVARIAGTQAVIG
jgi:hypothetical protein